MSATHAQPEAGVSGVRIWLMAARIRTLPAAVAGNATGAGDAVAAGLVHGLVLGLPWDERLRHAVALGTASAAAPVAGEFSHADYTSVLAAVTVHREEAR